MDKEQRELAHSFTSLELTVRPPLCSADFQLARRAGFFLPHATPSASDLRQEWEMWVASESRRRLGFTILMRDVSLNRGLADHRWTTGASSTSSLPARCPHSRCMPRSLAKTRCGPRAIRGPGKTSPRLGARLSAFRHVSRRVLYRARRRACRTWR